MVMIIVIVGVPTISSPSVGAHDLALDGSLKYPHQLFSWGLPGLYLQGHGFPVRVLSKTWLGGVLADRLLD